MSDEHSSDNLLRKENLVDQLAHLLRREIQGVEGRASRWKPGEKLPSELDLSTEYGVSRQTVRGALNILREDGLLATRQGKGTIVKEVPFRIKIANFTTANQVPGLGPWERACRDADLPGHTQMISTLIVDADREVAAALGLRQGDPVVQRITHQHAGDPDQVVQIQVGYIPLRLPASEEHPDGLPLAEGTPFAGHERMRDGIYATFKQIGYPPRTVSVDHTATRPTAREAFVLGVPDNTPMIQMDRITWSGDHAIEYRRVIGPGHSNVFSYDNLPL